MQDCNVEITICDPQEAPVNQATIGEVYIVDKDAREAYLPLVVADPSNPKLKTTIDSSTRILDYVKFDHYFEEEYGRTEAYRMELRLDANGALLQLDLGTYATRKKLRQFNGNKSRWFNCSEAKSR